MTESTKLPYTWVLWYHDPNNQDYSLESYIKIQEIKTVQDFWNITDTITKEAWESGMFFLMREGYRPLWDAPENAKGGAWSKKIDAHDTHRIFIDCMVHTIVNKFLNKYGEAFVGVTLSPKGNFHIIKMWVTTTSVNDRRLMSPSLMMKNSDDIAYRAHNLRPK